MPTALARTLGVLNGTVGDYLARTNNALATPMAITRDGSPITPDQAARELTPSPTPKLALLLHGLMGTELDWRFPTGTDYGDLLARDLGFTPIRVRYNTGVSISENGAALAQLLNNLTRAYPLDLNELMLIGHSMGGLVARAACHVAGLEHHPWLTRVRRAVYLGTPHLGAPAERVGRFINHVLHAIDDPYTQLIAQIADLRSAGIKDLGDADLRAEDRALRTHHVSLRSVEHPVPLLPSIEHLLIAGTLFVQPTVSALFGDGVVPLASACNGLVSARIVPGVSHMNLARDSRIYDVMRTWYEETR